MVAVISCTNSCEHCFSIGSNSHDLTGADATNRSTSDYVTVSKQTSGTTEYRVVAHSGHRSERPIFTAVDNVFPDVRYFLNKMITKALRHVHRAHIRWHCRYVSVTHDVSCDVK